MGKLRPNTLMLGYKSNWRTCDPRESLDYFSLIQSVEKDFIIVSSFDFHTYQKKKKQHSFFGVFFKNFSEAFDNYLAVGILRLQDGLDYSLILEEEDILATAAYLAVPNQTLSASVDSNMHLRHNMSSSQLSTGKSS